MIYINKFFNGIESNNFFASKKSNMKEEVAKMKDDEINNCDFDEWASYLSEKYNLLPITLFEESINKTIVEAKVKRYNPYSRFYTFEPQYYDIDGFRITFEIPFDGEAELFNIKPNTHFLLNFDVQGFYEPIKEKCGYFKLDFEYTKQELESKGNNILEFVQRGFEEKFKNYRTMITNVNKEVSIYNESLFGYAKSLLEERKKKADSFALISSALQIPLPISKSAPNIKPAQLKRIVRAVPSKPTTKPVHPESYISDDDYNNINNIIYTYGTTMEKTAKTYFLNTEEELRDHLLAALNTHYYNATGETFRKIGKTDINIEFENKAAFIGECKIWHGEQLFQDAIQQILNYSTWRDVKVSVIIFNKENKSFPMLLSKIANWISDNTKAHVKEHDNFWKCKYHWQAMNVDMQLTILAFDLYVDKTQFSDPRC